jgi:SEC-C motif-containing protein
MRCPCNDNASYQTCCGRYIENNELPATPEILMRSRYTAFVYHKMAYLTHTMKGKALKNFNFNGLENWLQRVQWQGLTVINTKMISKTHGFVTFKANYLEETTPCCIHERSEFKKIAGQWFYIDGTIK